MSGRDKTRFDNMIPFFGKADDQRVRLYLRVLEDEYAILAKNNLNPNTLAGLPLKFTKREDLSVRANPRPLNEIPPQLQKGYHSNYDNGAVLGNPDAKDTHADWMTFFNNLENRLAGLTKTGYVPAPPPVAAGAAAPARYQVTPKYAQDTILPLIQKTTDPFFVKVIQAHLLNLTDSAGVQILATPNTWPTATNFTFKPAAPSAGADISALRIAVRNALAVIPVDLAAVDTAKNALVAALGIRAVYDNGFSADQNDPFPDLADTATNFPNFNISKYFLHMKLENAASNLGEDTFWSTAAPLTNVYYRNPSDPKKVFTTDANGVEVDVSRGSAEHLKLASDKCAGTKVKPDNTRTCEDYISKCLIGNAADITACKEFMADENFWEIMQKDVNEMIPSVIVDTLNRFGFEIDSSNKNYKLYESVGSWTKRLSEKVKKNELTDAEYKNISKNTKLNTYLDLLVTKINQNPAIINENYFESSKLNPYERHHRFKGWVRAGLLNPRIIYKKDENLNREIGFISSNFARNREIVQRRLALTPNGIVNNGVLLSLVGGVPVFQVGGDGINENLSKHADHLKNLLKHVETKLQIMGKTLDVNTKEQIRKHIAQYEDAENKLFKAIAYSEEYIKLIEVYKEYDKNNVLNMDHLKSFVEARDRYFDKAESKQVSVISTLKEIGDSINALLKEDEDPTKVSTTNTANFITNNN
jgi:hypothetical protein